MKNITKIYETPSVVKLSALINTPLNLKTASKRFNNLKHICQSNNDNVYAAKIYSLPVLSPRGMRILLLECYMGKSFLSFQKRTNLISIKTSFSLKEDRLHCVFHSLVSHSSLPLSPKHLPLYMLNMIYFPLVSTYFDPLLIRKQKSLSVS